MNKLDPRSRRWFRRVLAEGASSKPASTLGATDAKAIEALIRTEGPPTAEQEEALRQAGWRTLSPLGRVLTGTVAGPRELEALLRLPFVRQVEISRPLYQELNVEN